VLSENAIQQGRLWSWRPNYWAAYVEPGLAPLYEAVLSACELPTGATLLDAGCGAGGAMLAALKRGIQVSGFDAATGFLAFARTRLPSTGAIELQLGDLHSIPFSDHQFDTAMAINSLQFTSDPAAAVRELARVVRRRVVVAVWHRPGDCDLRHVPAAIAALLPQPPKGRGPFEL
jgi:SAM-dependent methyltransferase